MESKFLFVILCLSIVTGQKVNEKIEDEPRQDDGIVDETEVAESNDWSQAVAEKLIGDEDDLLARSRIIKRQIIKIPSGVTKVKVFSPEGRPKRMPTQVRPQQQRRPPRRYIKRPNPEEEVEEPQSYRTQDGKKIKRHPKKPKIVVKEISREEFYSDDDDYLQSKRSTHEESSHQKHKKKTRKSHKHYDSHTEPDQSQKYSRKRPAEESGNYNSEIEFSQPVQYHHTQYSPSYMGQESTNIEEYAASNVYAKRVPAPDQTGLKIVDPPNMTKESMSYTNDEGVDYLKKKLPSAREIQSIFQQQYTSHNPNVATNFGLDDGKSKIKKYSKTEYFGTNPFDGFVSQYGQQTAAASEQHIVTSSAGSSGLQVVQPPQFGAPSTPAPTQSNQRATIRDILQLDCPNYDILGYCSSPPRYPTVQISNMVTKCAELLDAMTAPFPMDPQDDLSSFSSRSDDLDIIFVDDANDTKLLSDVSFPDSWSSWRRSGSDSETACNSEYTIIEPGYAREVTTGRWFVIVQNPETSLQKVTTDTCSSPGKPCGGLAGMKCSRSRGYHNGIKSTRCIQRYTHQRLISWDPETPNKCPRIRVFKFPTACVCHLKRI